MAVLALACGACRSAPVSHSVAHRMGPVEVLVLPLEVRPQAPELPLPLPLTVEQSTRQPKQRLLPASMIRMADEPLPVVPKRDSLLDSLETPANLPTDDLTLAKPSWAGLQLDLGAGQAPYDDAPPSNAMLPSGVRGFSDSLLRLTVEEPLGSGISLVGVVAAQRFIDEPIMDGLSDAEVSWISIGISFRF